MPETEFPASGYGKDVRFSRGNGYNKLKFVSQDLRNQAFTFGRVR